MPRRVTDEAGNVLYQVESPEERRQKIQEDLQRYGGKPTYETSMSEVPPSMRDVQDYRPNPNQGGRYDTFYKKEGRFAGNSGDGSDENMSRMSEADMENFPTANREPQPLPPAANRNNMIPKMTIAEQIDAEEAAKAMERAKEGSKVNPRSSDTMRAAARISTPDENAPLERTGFEQARPIDQYLGREQIREKLKESKDFLKMLGNRQKSQSKYKKR